MRIGVVYSRLRVEEKWLFADLEKRGIDHERIKDSDFIVDLADPQDWQRFDAVIIRSLSASRGLYAAQVFNSWGIPTVNPYSVGEICVDKVRTTSVLAAAGVPQPRTMMAFTPESAVKAGEALGYPYVVKPIVGSWGRMVSKINDLDAAEAVFEHKQMLGGFQQQIFYLQEMINKPGRDIRAFVIGDQTTVAIYRHAEHWVTNTARGAKASVCEVTDEIHAISQAAANAVGGGVLAIDLLEDPERGYLVNEVNHTMEYHSTVPLTGVDLPGMIVDHALKLADKKTKK